MGWVTYGRAVAAAKALAVILSITAPAVATAETEILALGDSLTQGYGLVPEDGFVPQLQAFLDAQGVEARVINGGVSGDTTAGGLSRVEWSLTPDTEAMIVALGGNDLLRGLPPEMSRANLDGILKIAAEKGLDVLLVGMEAPGNYGPEFKATFDAMYPELAETYGVNFAPSFFEGLQSEGDTLADITAFMQADGIHPNADGVRRIVEGLGPRVAAMLAE